MLVFEARVEKGIGDRRLACRRELREVGAEFCSEVKANDQKADTVTFLRDEGIS